MSIIIRLQGLPMEANSLDIRRFFQGLHIPDGGVHIVGGQHGDAFIAFSSDEDARQAMERSGRPIKNSTIKLLLSSRNEMQKVIDIARSQTPFMISGAPTGAHPAVAAAPLGISYGQQYPTQGTQVPSAKPLSQQFETTKAYQPPYTGNQSVSSIQPAPIYGMPQVQPLISKDLGGGGDAFIRPATYRSRSRSRSPPEPRTQSRIPTNEDAPASPPIGMQSGLLGSLNAPPSVMASQELSHRYRQNGSYSNGSNDINVRQPTQGAFENNDLYGNYSRPSHPGPAEDIPKYDERWNPPSVNANQNMVPPGGGHPDGFRHGHDAYPNSSGPPSGTYHHPPGHVQGQYSVAGQLPTSAPPIPLPHQQPPSAARTFPAQMYNLAPNVRPRDVMEFFAPLYITEESVKFMTDDRGYPNGVAVVHFATPRDLDGALSYNNRYLLDKLVYIRPLDEMNGPRSSQQPPPPSAPPTAPPPVMHGESFQEANYSSRYPPEQPVTYGSAPFATSPTQQPQGPNKELTLYMKGLPFSSCTTKDIKEFFQPIRLANIEIERDSRGKLSGNAFVEFENRTDYSRAVEYNYRHMGHRYIELIPLYKLEKHRQRLEQPSVQTFCISVRGLSPSITSQDLKHFFNEAGARPYAVHIMLTPDQTNAGEAYLEFTDKEAQKRALRRDGTYLGQEQISVTMVSYNEVIAALHKPTHLPPVEVPQPNFPTQPDFPEYFSEPKTSAPFRPEKSSFRRPIPPFVDKSAVLVVVDCPSKTKEDDLCVFFSDYHITPDRVRFRYTDKSTDALVSFLSRTEAEHALRNMDKKYFIGKHIQLQFE